MAVPESVRKVKRPVNTIVEDSGRDTVYRYSVRERGEIVYESGGNPRTEGSSDTSSTASLFPGPRRQRRSQKC